MYVYSHKGKNGKTVYRIVYRDDSGKTRRLPKSEIPHFRSDEDAQAWVKTQAAIRSSRKAYMNAKLAWKTKHYCLNDSLDKFASWQKKKAPNSWESSVYYLQHWIFPFYSQEKNCVNFNDWHLFFRELLDWLQGDEVLVRKGRKDKLATNTINKIVAALNSFLKCLGEYNQIDKDSIKKCPAIDRRYLNKRGYKDTIPEKERDLVMAELVRKYPGVEDFFYVLWHTGMRFLELFSMPMSAVFKGPVPDGQVLSEMQKLGLPENLGYLYLESQSSDDSRQRSEDGSLVRKPLKSCPAIGPKYSRTIPIWDKKAWQIILKLYLAQKELLAKNAWGRDPANYLLFNNLTWEKTVNGLRLSYQALKLPPKGYHSCRHTFTTRLVGETKSYYLVRLITGHKSQSAFENYLHIYEQIGIESKRNNQEITQDDLDDIR